jgi:hypothetical protein
MGPPSGLTCPECGGALWETRNGKNGKLLRYRCHVGHGYSTDGLLSEHSRNLEAALWTALRALEENADLRRRLAQRSKDRNWSTLARQYEQQANDAAERAAVIREVLTSDKLEVRAKKSIPRSPHPVVEETNKGRRGRNGRAAKSAGGGNGAGATSRAATKRGNSGKAKSGGQPAAKARPAR